MSFYDSDGNLYLRLKRLWDGLENLFMKLKRLLGRIFRILFISSIGFIAYFWFDPQPLGDIPFSQLTLNLIFNNIFGGGIALGCFVLLFTYPEADMIDDPDNAWADFVGSLIFLGLCFIAFIHPGHF